MITNTQEYEVTLKQIDMFEVTLSKLVESPELDGRMVKIQREAITSQLDEMKQDVKMWQSVQGAAVILNIHPDLDAPNCRACNGTGSDRDINAILVDCAKCEGTGKQR